MKVFLHKPAKTAFNTWKLGAVLQLPALPTAMCLYSGNKNVQTLPLLCPAGVRPKQLKK
jgi:hypothetical protein